MSELINLLKMKYLHDLMINICAVNCINRIFVRLINFQNYTSYPVIKLLAKFTTLNLPVRANCC